MSTHNYIQYNQPGGSFYAITINALEIINRLEIRRRSQDSDSGIQRDDDKKRVKDIENYLQKPEAIIPTPIIVSAFRDTVRIENNSLEISEASELIGHILDGQHRVLGLRALAAREPLQLKQIELLIVFVFEIDIYSEATIFSTINSNQKQVSKSLIYDLFSLDPNRSKPRVCHEIVKSLNDDYESPFYRKIKILGKKIEDTETLSQAAFIDQLLKSINATNSEIGAFYESNEDWAIRKSITNVFNAINSALEQSPHNYPADYFYRTSGYGGIIQSINDLISAGKKQGTISKEYFEKIFLKYLKNNPSPSTGTGNSAMLEVKRGIIEAISEMA